jgi:hypothetical protein
MPEDGWGKAWVDCRMKSGGSDASVFLFLGMIEPPLARSLYSGYISGYN